MKRFLAMILCVFMAVALVSAQAETARPVDADTDTGALPVEPSVCAAGKQTADDGRSSGFRGYRGRQRLRVSPSPGGNVPS